ncbi:MAG: hypothetical protein CMJ31_01990 [Phycisphaerae bacterium]|nr:hypothetical protein [Phycisphaerae bacterium]
MPCADQSCVQDAALSRPVLNEARRVGEAVDAHINAWLDRREAPDPLRDAVRYAVMNGGKRLRPTLCVLCAEAVGGTEAGERAIPAAAALELVHAFSLVHDDLPAMDDDDMRRGGPTLHVRSGEALAILAGDAMLAMAFELILAGPHDERAERATAASELAAATTDMVSGQVYDTLGGFPDGLSDEDRVRLTHRNKTGALLRAACRVGAIVAAAGAEQLDAVTRYGEAVGLMYQIVDDLIDLSQTAEHVGKATGKDADAGKLTYPGAMGIEASRRAIGELKGAAIEALARLGANRGVLADVCEYLSERTK